MNDILSLDNLVTLVLYAMLVVTALAIVWRPRLFEVVILSGVFSLLCALVFMTLDAVDVAFTEAAVGAGVSTVLLLGTIALTKPTDRKPRHSATIPFLVVFVTGAALVYGTLDMPAFGSADAPAQTYLYPDFFERSPHEIDVPNVVTAILGSYRGFDTLGEVAVVFTAGVGVLLLLSGLQRRRRKEEDAK